MIHYYEKLVIRKSDIAIATETKPIPETRPNPEPKPRLIHMVACKTVVEYKRNQEKIRKFCLEEARTAKLANKPLATGISQATIQGSSNTHDLPGPSRTPSDPKKNTISKKPTEKEGTKKAQKRPIATRFIPSKTRWSKDKIVKLATKNQKKQ